MSDLLGPKGREDDDLYVSVPNRGNFSTDARAMQIANTGLPGACFVSCMTAV